MRIHSLAAYLQLQAVWLYTESIWSEQRINGIENCVKGCVHNTSLDLVRGYWFRRCQRIYRLIQNRPENQTGLNR